MMRHLWIVLTTAGLWSGPTALRAADSALPADSPSGTPSSVGRVIEEFRLDDFRGQSHALSDFQDSKLVVVVFLGTECPLAKLYTGRLVELAREYEPRGVAFVGINSNVQDSITELASYARRHGITFPLLKDVGNKVADQFGAQRTPEAFVLDADRRVRYHGRIDDQFLVGGIVRDEPTRQDLRVALDELLSGRDVSVPEAEPLGCIIGRIRQPKANAAVTWSNQISRIVYRRCVECHREGDIAPFALTEYDEVAGWAEMIAEVVRENRMPPWHADPRYGNFANDRRLSEEEKRLIYQWVADGAPQGDPAQLPELPHFVEGWQLPYPPDEVFAMRDKPFTVPAEGEVRYQYFSIDPGFKEDKWVKAAEILPGNRAVVHHVIVFVRPPVGSGRQDFDVRTARFLVGYVPGLRAVPFPEGMAKLIPAGSKLVFQVHYTPIGSVQSDLSRVGLVYADPDEVRYRVITRNAVNTDFRIPPHADDYVAKAATRAFPKEALLLSFMPHMHLRGKSFRYEAVFPVGGEQRREVLLDVPHYDFNWQTSYVLAKPMPLPAGTRIECVAHYDNSEDNPANPDPTVTVRWGDQTWDEMMIGYFDVAVPVDPKQAAREDLKLGRQLILEAARERALQVVKRFDRNGDGRLQKAEVPDRLARYFPRVDADGDGVISADELANAFTRR